MGEFLAVTTPELVLDCIACRPVRLCPLHANADRLLAAAEEAREVLAACIRVLASESDIATDNLVNELYKLHVADGFGVRLQDAIAACKPTKATK